MNAGLLCTVDGLTEWFEKTYPGLHLYSEGNTDIFSHEVVLLMESYLIGGKAYTLRPLWEKFMRVDKKLRYKTLVVIGYGKHPQSNYHSLYEPQESLELVFQRAKPLSEHPDYYQSTAIDIRDPLSALLKSHYKSNMQDLLTEGWKKLKPIEKELANGRLIHQLDPIKVQEVRSIFSDLEMLWRDFQGFFSLMPQYPQMQCLPLLLQEVDDVLFPGVDPKEQIQQVYKKLMDFLKQIIVPITQKYKLEQR